jgi:hypothetical protein
METRRKLQFLAEGFERLPEKDRKYLKHYLEELLFLQKAAAGEPVYFPGKKEGRTRGNAGIPEGMVPGRNKG